MNNVYDTVIEGSPYEVRFDFRGEQTENQLEAFRQQFVSDPKILDAQLLYGNARTEVTQSGTSYSISTLAYLEAEIFVEYNNQTYSNSEGRIFSVTGKMRGFPYCRKPRIFLFWEVEKFLAYTRRGRTRKVYNLKLFPGNAQHFLEGGHSLEHLLYGTLP